MRTSGPRAGALADNRESNREEACKGLISQRLMVKLHPGGKDGIDRSEIEEVVLSGEIIEKYPDDKYSPSCLIYGRSKAGRHLHVQLSMPPIVVVITAYAPDEAEWMDYRIRRKKK